MTPTRGNTSIADAPSTSPGQPVARGATVIRTLTGRRAADIVHYVSLVAAAVALFVLNRNQWFFFDEWSFMGDAAAELWAGHGGHWSTVAVGLWMALQAIFGLSSYLPFITVAIIVHLLTAHLLWRLMLRTESTPWIATGASAVFLLLGAAGENLLWAFQYAFMGAIACGLGAILIALRPRMTVALQIWVCVLLVVGLATSGTLLPFLLPVALIVLRRHGWRRLWITIAVPVIVYAIWYLFIAGPNSNAVFQARGVEILLTPQFAGALLVDSLSKMVPLPYVGAVLFALLGMGMLLLMRQRLADGAFAAIAVAGAGVLFAFLTAYSRWHTGLPNASSGRYVYVVFVSLAPIGGLLLTWIIGRSRAGLLLVAGALALIFVYNFGTLVTLARSEAARERYVHEAISAGLEMQRIDPGAVDSTRSPEPTFQPVLDLAELTVLADQDGLTTIAYGREPYLTALVNVGTIVTPSASPGPSCNHASVGDHLLSGDSVSAPGTVTVEVAAVDPDGSQGRPRTITLDSGTHVFTTFDSAPLLVTGVSGKPDICRAE